MNEMLREARLSQGNNDHVILNILHIHEKPRGDKTGRMFLMGLNKVYLFTDKFRMAIQIAKQI